MNLFEFATFLVELGFESAINLDGGGSATITAYNTLITEPSWKCTEDDFNALKATADDDIKSLFDNEAYGIGEQYRMCEKPVSSVTCIHPLMPPDDSLLLPDQVTPHSNEPSMAPTVAVTKKPTKYPTHPPTVTSPISATQAPNSIQYNYSNSYVANVIYKLELYQFSTFTLAIILVMSLTANGWWMISYNALKQKSTNNPNAISSSSYKRHVGNNESRSTRPGQAIEMTRKDNRQVTQYSDLEAVDSIRLNEYEGPDDSNDEETTLMLGNNKINKHASTSSMPGGFLNPFQRR